MDFSVYGPSLVSGFLAAIVVVVSSKIEIRELWRAIRRHEKVHDDLWHEIKTKADK